MAIRYEYSSTCCAHLYLETRNADTAPIVINCNVCGQGAYLEVSQTEIETIAEPVYQVAVESEVETLDGTQTHAIIDRGNGEFTSMLKSTYDELKANEAKTI